MDKIRDMLKGIGASDEAAAAICEALDQYKQQVHAQLQEGYNAKLVEAKGVLVAKFDEHKAKLARRMQVFLESKARQVEEAARRQLVNEEGEAVNKLRRVKALLEDVNIDTGASKQVTAYQKTVARLEDAIATLSEERREAVAKANQGHKIALTHLKRNQLLEGVLRQHGVVIPEDLPPEFEANKGKFGKKDGDDKDDKKEGKKSGNPFAKGGDRADDKDGKKDKKAPPFGDADKKDDKASDKEDDEKVDESIDGINRELTEADLPRRSNSEDQEVMNESASGRRLDKDRRRRAPAVSTRRTLTEDGSNANNGDPEIEAIAQTMDY